VGCSEQGHEPLKKYGGKQSINRILRGLVVAVVNMVMNLWGFIKSREFIDQLSDYQILKNS
jgi:hypothetical protein